MYLTLKFLHIIGFISWMAGVLYLYRLFINHRENMDKGEEVHTLLCGMESRLFRIITVPALVVTVVCGLSMIWQVPALLDGPWMHVKLLAAGFLIVWTLYGGLLIKRFEKKDTSLPSSKTLRYMNEVPTVLMFVIVGMIIYRPWGG